jgi:hypothetical protein
MRTGILELHYLLHKLGIKSSCRGYNLEVMKVYSFLGRMREQGYGRKLY